MERPTGRTTDAPTPPPDSRRGGAVWESRGPPERCCGWGVLVAPDECREADTAPPRSASPTSKTLASARSRVKCSLLVCVPPPVRVTRWAALRRCGSFYTAQRVCLLHDRTE